MATVGSYYDLQVESAPGVDSTLAPRSKLIPIPFLLPIGLCALSWMAGGVPRLTDLGFLLLTIISVAYFFAELAAFPRRFGLGGIVLWGGIAIWFCYDYMTNWFWRDMAAPSTPFSPDVIAKAAFFHGVFIFFAAIGLLLNWGKPLVRLMGAVPEPNSGSFYFILVVLSFIVGMVPYLFFTAEPWYVSIYKGIVGGRTNATTVWTVGRTGNINFNWGAYIGELLAIGQAGSILAVFYAVLLARSRVAKFICWADWLFWMALGFGGGSRGEIGFLALPVLGLLFLKYYSRAAALYRRFSIRAYVIGALVGLALLILVQIQAKFRDVGFSGVDFGALDTTLKGNSMFSEGLLGYQLIPDTKDYIYDTVPGEVIVRPIPQAIFDFIIGPIPRVLWHDKPVDPAIMWMGEAVTGQQYQGQGMNGTTVTPGLVGFWFFKYGVFGVIEGGILFGLLARIMERAFQNCEGRLLRLFLALGIATWLFRCFREFAYLFLYPLLIGLLAIAFAIWIFNLFTGGSSAGHKEHAFPHA